MAKKKKATKKKTTKKKFEKRDVNKGFWFALKDKEIEEKGIALAKALAKKGSIEAEFSDVKKSWKSKLDEQEAEINELTRTINARKEYREVDCVEIKDFQKCTVTYKQGTKIIESREMKADERQMAMKVQSEENSLKKAEKNLKEEAKKFNESKNGNVRNLVFPGAKNDSGLKDVMREETSKLTKKSSVDSKDGKAPSP